MTDYTNDINNIINESLTSNKHWINMSNNSYPNYVKYVEGKFPLNDKLTLLTTIQSTPLICKFKDTDGNIVIYKLILKSEYNNYYLRQLVKKLATKITELENRIKDLEMQPTDEVTV